MPEPTRVGLSDEDLAFRRHYIGASDVPIILGLSQTTPAELLRKKVLGEQHEQSEEAEWGHRLEAAVIDKTFEASGLKRRKRLERRTLHPKMPWTGFTPDAIGSNDYGGLWVIQVKTTGLNNWDDWADGVPQRVRAQALWEAWVLQEARPRANVLGTLVGALVGGQTYYSYPVMLSPTSVAEMLPHIQRYRDQLETVTPEAIPGDTSAWGAPLKLGKPVEMLNDFVDQTAHQYLRARDQVAEGEASLRQARELLTAEIPPGRAGIVTPFYRVTMVRSKRSPVPFLKVTARP